MSTPKATHSDSGNGSRNGSVRRPVRGANGCFLPGGPGGPGRRKRPKTATNTDIRILRRRILESWDRVNGDRLLDDLAQTDPRAYLKLVTSILPREGGVTVNVSAAAGVTQNSQASDERTKSVLARLMACNQASLDAYVMKHLPTERSDDGHQFELGRRAEQLLALPDEADDAVG